MISEGALSAKEIYDKPTFDIKFSSNGYDHTIKCVEGVFVSYNINPNVWSKISSDSQLTLKVLTYESQGPFNIKEIWEKISRQYTELRSRTQRDKATRYADSLFLNIKKALAPIYTEIVNNYKAELEKGKEEAKDEQTKKAYDDFITGLEAENGANIADIEKDRIIKGAIEGLLYGIPAIICIYLIIKKIRS
jgi:hypothetical protein